MLEIMPYLLCLNQSISTTQLRQFAVITSAMLRCRGRVTMLNLSRWSDRGGSYRSIQRFYNTSICWLGLNWALFMAHKFNKDEVYLMAGDETMVTKSGQSTHGLGRFFSSIHSRTVKGIGFFSLCLIGVSSKEATPLLMEQLDPQMKKQTRPPKAKPKGSGKRGRPRGSKNKNRRDVELTDYLKWIQRNILRTLGMMGNDLKVTYFLYDGAFGNNECLQMVKSCGLQLISKLQCKSALWYPDQGEYKGIGPKSKYGEKVDYSNLPQEHLVQHSLEEGVEERIYQFSLWHRSFSDQLNVTIIQRKRIKDGKWAQVILFSNDLNLSWDRMILYYRLRFQIEFTYRDAKQFWGLEDFMNIKPVPVENAANLSMFMVNISQMIRSQTQEKHRRSVLDLKAQFQATFYLDKIIKINPQIQRVISFKQIQNALVEVGCIHQMKKAA